MYWIKKGLIYEARGNNFWNKSHASLPTVYRLDDKRLRVYFSSRDEKNRTHVGYIEVLADNPREILYEHDQPVLIPGEIGMFDDCGVMASHVIDVGDEVWMYYLGWNVRNTISYHNSIGLAISKDGGQSFHKFSKGPLFDRNHIEPFYSAVPYILRENGTWKMWYLSNTKWVEYNGQPEPYYHIKYAESKNGIDWVRNGTIAIDFKNKEECGIVRSCVLKDSDRYKMWYSYRNLNNYRKDKSNSYRIGYAESLDGMNWDRKDDIVGIDVSPKGWDSEMIEYPFVYDHRGKRYMVYNGNTFGKTGFGYAILE